MKFTWSTSRALIVAAALVLITNAIALGGVAYNRSGEPDSVLQLTERELPLQFWSWPENENSAVHMQLRWRVSGGTYEWDHDVEWLTPEQLRALGFDLPAAGASQEELQRYAKQSAREVFFALELDGPAYQRELERRRNDLREAEAKAAAVGSTELRDHVVVAQKFLQEEEQTASRLFVVAVDVDAAVLRQRYSDRRKYAVVSGRLELHDGVKQMLPMIDDVNVDAIRVPYAYRKLVEPLLADRSYAPDRKPRYAASVHFGRRLEPWIVQLSRM
jgi:hypothetical protein